MAEKIVVRQGAAAVFASPLSAVSIFFAISPHPALDQLGADSRVAEDQ